MSRLFYVWRKFTIATECLLSKAAKALARFLRLHPHNIGQKTEIMVEHFQQHTRHKIGGHAKAMVVTGSRLEAVRYKQAFDEYISAKGYPIKKPLDDPIINHPPFEV